MNGLQSLTQWENDFNHPTGSMLGLLNAIQVRQLFTHYFRNYNLTRSQNIGSLGGYPFAPYLSDGIGRRLTVFLGALIMCAGVAIQTASNSVKMFIGAR